MKALRRVSRELGLSDPSTFPERVAHLRALGKPPFLPEGGTTLAIEGIAPTEYFEGVATVTLSVNGSVKVMHRVRGREFRLTAHLERSGQLFQDVVLETSESFVPNRKLRNGDGRRLSLRIYDVRFVQEEPVAMASIRSIPLSGIASKLIKRGGETSAVPGERGPPRRGSRPRWGG